jgi:anti-sigma regulatory factor (Ser/Thr protein kinase)
MLLADPPDLASELSERKIGGLGVFLARKLIADIRYYREDNKNILKITV